jgi:hypothetical protein
MPRTACCSPPPTRGPTQRKVPARVHERSRQEAAGSVVLIAIRLIANVRHRNQEHLISDLRSVAVFDHERRWQHHLSLTPCRAFEGGHREQSGEPHPWLCRTGQISDGRRLSQPSTYRGAGTVTASARNGVKLRGDRVIEPGHRAQQAVRIGMLRVVENVAHRRFFDDASSRSPSCRRA